MSDHRPGGRAMPAGMTADNWRKHPFAPWAFANVTRFLPTARIGKARCGRDLASREALDLTAIADARGRSFALSDFLRRTHADAFLVLHRGTIAFEHYAAATSPGTRHLCFSMTKSMVGLLAELLIADELLDPEAVAAKLVPELAGSAFAHATARDLLDMRDGVGFDENYTDPDAQIHRYSRHFWGAGEGGTLGALRVLAAPVAAGRPFRYRTPVTDVLGLMIERATGSTLPLLAEHRLWGPAGAADDAAWVLDTGGRAIASAGFACTLRDLARFGLLLIDAAHGRGPGEAGRRAAASIMAGGDRAAFAAADQPTRPGWSYRSGWWIDHATCSANALGVFGQRLHVAPADEVVIARFGSHPMANNQATDELHARVFDAVKAVLRGR